MAVPQIDLLPPPALPTDPEDVFDAKVGASLTAEQNMVPQINTSLTWIGQQVAAVSDYRQQAAQSASNAADSASAANGSKTAAAKSATDATSNGAAQVNLAKDQVALSKQYADSSQTSAAAAQAAAGLPSLAGNAYKVLRVTANGQAVEWGLGLPPLPSVAGAPGKVATIAANGTSLVWAELYKVGDLFTTARSPGSLWLPADGSVRAQSAYPALFAALGLLGNSLGAIWQTVTIPISANIGGAQPFGVGQSGTVIALTSAGMIARSTDRGLTFGAAVDISAGVSASFQGISTNGTGIWIAFTSNLNGFARKSVDDGLTWTTINLWANSAAGYSILTYLGNSTWIASRGTNDTYLAITTNDGASWSTVEHGMGSVTVSAMASDEKGVAVISAGTNVRRTANFGATWATATTPAAAIGSIATDKAGKWAITGSNGSTNTYFSVNNGISFSLVAMPTTTAPTRVVSIDGGFAFTLGSGSSGYTYLNNVYATFPYSGSPNNFAHAGNNLLLSVGASMFRGLPYAYDSSTQFQLPLAPVITGVKTYVKAQDLAA